LAGVANLACHFQHDRHVFRDGTFAGLRKHITWRCGLPDLKASKISAQTGPALLHWAADRGRMQQQKRTGQ
jgi:hypothetical protein